MHEDPPDHYHRFDRGDDLQLVTERTTVNVDIAVVHTTQTTDGSGSVWPYPEVTSGHSTWIQNYDGSLAHCGR